MCLYILKPKQNWKTNPKTFRRGRLECNFLFRLGMEMGKRNVMAGMGCSVIGAEAIEDRNLLKDLEYLQLPVWHLSWREGCSFWLGCHMLLLTPSQFERVCVYHQHICTHLTMSSGLNSNLALWRAKPNDSSFHSLFYLVWNTWCNLLIFFLISQQITDLKKENFNLKLRIYFLEERMQQKFDGPTEEIYKIVCI